MFFVAVPENKYSGKIMVADLDAQRGSNRQCIIRKPKMIYFPFRFVVFWWSSHLVFVQATMCFSNRCCVFVYDCVRNNQVLKIDAERQIIA